MQRNSSQTYGAMPAMPPKCSPPMAPNHWTMHAMKVILSWPSLWLHPKPSVLSLASRFWVATQRVSVESLDSELKPTRDLPWCCYPHTSNTSVLSQKKSHEKCQHVIQFDAHFCMLLSLCSTLIILSETWMIESLVWDRVLIVSDTQLVELSDVRSI